MEAASLRGWIGSALRASPATRPLVPDLRAWWRQRRYRRLYLKYRDASMVAAHTFIDNLRLCERFGQQAGLVVECGV